MRARGLALLGAAALMLSACTAAARPRDAGLRVLAAETFLRDIAQNVAGEQLEVESILPAGVDPHAFQATPQDAIKIAQAQVLIMNGRGYEAWLEKSLKAGDGERIVVQASEGAGSGSDADPHLWMDPLNVVQYVENIRDALSQAQPEGKAEFAANAEAYAAELRDLDAWIRAQVEQIPPERRVLITNHHALEAFAEAYGFEIAGVVIPSYTSGAAPSAQQLAELIGTIQSLGAPAIFLDASENPDLAQQIAAESEAQVITGLYVETLSEPDGPAPTYLAMMRHDTGLIVEALR